jgi:hypothetical protein
MDDISHGILVDVNAELSQLSSALRVIARHEETSKDHALSLVDIATRIGSVMKMVNNVTGWNGKDFSGTGDRVSASYDVPGLHDLGKRIAETVASFGKGEIDSPVPPIIEAIFPGLVGKQDSSTGDR